MKHDPEYDYPASDIDYCLDCGYRYPEDEQIFQDYDGYAYLDLIDQGE